ncbi:MAG: hypothetical protein M1838_004716 [Thelocarpon superellum]|nr:MAG: hypothetical protein M1838_004716 [Thelocarpon superellum]
MLRGYQVEDEAAEGEIAMPTSIEGIEFLVTQLYRPGSPEQIAKIQEKLQKLQRSDYGWQIADALLANDRSDEIRFFGALTFTVKLNLDGDSLDVDAAQALLDRLLSWFLRWVTQSASAMVLKKLCSTLVAYFIRFPTLWEQCMRHVLGSFYQGAAIPLSGLDKLPDTDILVAGLGPAQCQASLWFSTTLVDEVSKINSSNMKQQNYHDKMMLNVRDAVSLIQHVWTSDGGAELPTVGPAMVQSPAKEGMASFQSWVLYAHRAFVDATITLEPLRQLTARAMHLLEHQEVFGTAADCFIDILTNFPLFLTREQLQMLALCLTADWAQRRMQPLLEGVFDEESMPLARLLLAFGEATVPELAQAAPHLEPEKVMYMLHSLLACPGYPVAEDEICTQALDFWASYAEFLIDTTYADDAAASRPWFPRARERLVHAVHLAWKKTRLPPPADGATWDADEKKGFKDYRKDVADFLQSAYAVLGLDMAVSFARIAVQSLQPGASDEAEAALTALNALSDYVSLDQQRLLLRELLSPPIFDLMSRSGGSVSATTTQALLTLIGRYAHYFEVEPTHLAPALNFLFRALGEPASATSAARSISALCASCRETLTPELHTFLQQYQTLVTQQPLDAMTREKVLGGIAAVVQALPTAEARVEPMRVLLSLIQANVQHALDLARAQDEAAAEAGVEALQCLKAIGKGLQDLEDGPIELDEEPDGSVDSTFWDQGPGAEVQGIIVHMIELMRQTFPASGDIVEAACATFRTGFAERMPGPFVFPPEVTTSFLLHSDLHTPRLGLMLATACAWLGSHTTDSSGKIDEQAQALLEHVAVLMHSLGGPGEDPDVAQNCIDVVRRFIPRFLNVLLGLKPDRSLEHVFLFTLDCLRGHELLPKRSAATFWAAFVVLVDEPEPTQSTLRAIMQHVGPLLAAALMANIGGEAARSELDLLAESLKKLVWKQAGSKRWLEAALVDSSFPSQRVTEADKREFLQKVMSLRGSRATTQVVKDFWLACRGSHFAYTS